MGAKLVIKFDGVVRGIAEKRLSVSAFGPALGELLKALRRTASNIFASSEAETGRLSQDSGTIDIELVAIQDGSLEIVSDATSAFQPTLFGDPLVGVVDRLLQDIESESSGRPASGAARKYIEALPQGLTRQEYVLYDGPREVRRVSVGEPSLAAEPVSLPRIARLHGHVAGVGFPPGESYVELLTDNMKKSIVCMATSQLTDAALALRGHEVDALAVIVGNKYRMLWLRDALAPFKPEEPDKRLSRHINDWRETLEILAK